MATRSKPKPLPKKKGTVKVKLNAGTAIFFQQLVHKGLASFELAPKMGDKATATISKDEKGKPNIIVNAAFICWAPEHME